MGMDTERLLLRIIFLYKHKEGEPYAKRNKRTN